MGMFSISFPSILMAGELGQTEDLDVALVEAGMEDDEVHEADETVVNLPVDEEIVADATAAREQMEELDVMPQ